MLRTDDMQNKQPSAGIAEISQDEIERQAWDLAKAAGRDHLSSADLEQAREQVLGKSSPDIAHLPTVEEADTD